MAEKKKGLHLSITTPSEIRAILEGRKHWLVLFGPDAVRAGMIDRVDRELGQWPSFPTLIDARLAVTIVPKSDVTARASLPGAGTHPRGAGRPSLRLETGH